MIVAAALLLLQASRAELPFSPVREAGGLVFLSGELGTVPGSLTLAPGGIEAETRAALENIRTTLAGQGLAMRDVVKCTVFMADMKEWAAMNHVYVTFFDKPYPARSALGASGLALGARVEIECIAARPAR